MVSGRSFNTSLEPLRCVLEILLKMLLKMLKMHAQDAGPDGGPAISCFEAEHFVDVVMSWLITAPLLV